MQVEIDLIFRLFIAVLTLMLAIPVTFGANAQTRNPWSMFQGGQTGISGGFQRAPPASGWQAPQDTQQSQPQVNNDNYVPLPQKQRKRQPWQTNSIPQAANPGFRQRYNAPGTGYQAPWQGQYGGQMGFGMSFNPGMGFSNMPFGFGFPAWPNGYNQAWPNTYNPPLPGGFNQGFMPWGIPMY